MVYVVIGLIVGASVTCTRLGFAQSYDIDQVRSALLLQIARNIVWPVDTNKSQFRIGVWRQPQLALSFAQLNQTSVNEKPIFVFSTDTLAQLASVDILYIPRARLSDLSNLARSLRGSGVLIITEESRTLHNVMINMKLTTLENGNAKFSFQINRPNIVFEGLGLAPELIVFGGTEIDIAELYYQTEKAILTLQNQNEVAAQKLQQQQTLYQEQQQAFSTLQRDFSGLQQQANALKVELDAKLSSIKAKEQQLLSLEAQVDSVNTQYTTALHLSEQKERELKNAETRLLTYEQNIQQQINKLNALNREIDTNRQRLGEQQSQLDQAQTAMREQSQVIDKQKDIIAITTLVVVAALAIALLITYLLFKIKRTKDTLQDTLEDLTQAQNKLVESEKLASLGQLVTGVAHEINTPLGISLTAVSTLAADAQSFKSQIETGHMRKTTALEFVDKIAEIDTLIQNNLQRCHELVNDFKQVSADQIVASSRDIQLKDYCLDVFNVLKTYLRQHRVNWEIHGDNPTITIDPGLLSQVINNLATNAVSHGFAKDQENPLLTVNIEDAADCCTIVFTDNGIGMSNTVRQRVFDPFYTTKRGSGGTGLGLNIVHTIVTQKLGGNIEVASEIANGTQFTIVLSKTN